MKQSEYPLVDDVAGVQPPVGLDLASMLNKPRMFKSVTCSSELLLQNLNYFSSTLNLSKSDPITPAPAQRAQQQHSPRGPQSHCVPEAYGLGNGSKLNFMRLDNSFAHSTIFVFLSLRARLQDLLWLIHKLLSFPTSDWNGVLHAYHSQNTQLNSTNLC